MLEAQDPETGQRMGPQDLIFNMQFFIVAMICVCGPTFLTPRSVNSADITGWPMLT